MSYVRQRTWIERGPRHYRGMGQVYPGSSCYDNSHDAGEVHCASVSAVIANAFNPSAIFGSAPNWTTTCSAQESSCIAANPTAAGASAPGTAPPDPCTQAIGVSCTMLILGGIAIVALITIGGRR